MTIDDRIPAIAVGMQAGELKEPYHPSLAPEDVRRVHDYAAQRSALQLESATDAYPHLVDLSRRGVRAVEIFGAWEQACVSSAVALALEQGMRVQVPKSYVFAYPQLGSASLVTLLSAVESIAYHLHVPWTSREDNTDWYFTPQHTSK